MPTNCSWTAENDRKLLLLMLKASDVKVSLPAVQESWGENPPTVKALTLRMGHLKKLAREYDSENPAFTPSGRGKKAGGTVKKEEGYVTPVSSPKQAVRTPKKGAKKRVAEKTEVTPRRTRRKVMSAKYVEEDTEEESDGEMKVEQDSDEEEEWKPAKADLDGAAEEEEIEEEEITAEEAHGDEMEADGEVNGEAEDKEDRVTDEIKDVSSALQEKLIEANPEVVS